MSADANMKAVLRAMQHNIEVVKARGPCLSTAVRELVLGFDWALRGIRFVPANFTGYDDRIGRRPRRKDSFDHYYPAEVPGLHRAGDSRFIPDAWDHPYCLKVGRRTVALVLEPYLGRFPEDRHSELLSLQEHGIDARVDRSFDRWNPPHTAAVVMTRLGETFPDPIPLRREQVRHARREYYDAVQSGFLGYLFLGTAQQHHRKLTRKAIHNA